MEFEFKDKVIKNLYDKSRLYFSDKIVLLDTIIDEIFKESDTLYDINERNTKIFKAAIGMYTNGKKISYHTVKQHLGISISTERIRKVTEQCITKLYDMNTNLMAKIVRENISLQIKILDEPLELIGIKYDIVNVLKKLGCITLNDVLLLDNEQLKLNFNPHDYQKIFKIINVFGLLFEFQIYELKEQPIEQLNLSRKTYKFVKNKNIKSFEQLLELQPVLTEEYYVEESIRAEIDSIQTKILDSNIIQYFNISRNKNMTNKLLSQLYILKEQHSAKLVNLNTINDNIEQVINTLKQGENYKYLMTLLKKKMSTENEIQNLMYEIELLNIQINYVMEIVISKKRETVLQYVKKI